ncbi:MAG: 16S rRNA (uracil(1498)-N(3))-methyltransferase [Spirochaetales bacterium]|nr:16S rRNA (uracil(1498)-N(3))-methyltransferase [Spirochaetales bacterium]
MRQFVLPGSWGGEPSCVITGRDARRLSGVLRLVPGDSFPALGPDGSPYTCSIVAASASSVTLRVDAAPAQPAGYLPDIRAGKTSDPLSRAGAPAAFRVRLPSITLAIGALQGSKLDDVVRAATEAGVATIIPLITARSVPAERIGGRMDRLRRIVAEALGQSGSPTPTMLREATSIAALCEAYPPVAGSRLGLFFHELPLAQASIHRYCTDVPEEIVACIGPEGGFDDDEIRALFTGGFVPAWLGPTVLRAETAAIFAVASLRIVCLERFSWSMIE